MNGFQVSDSLDLEISSSAIPLRIIEKLLAVAIVASS